VLVPDPVFVSVSPFVDPLVIVDSEPDGV